MTLPSSLSHVDSRKLCVRMSNACGYCLARLATLLRASECSCCRTRLYRRKNGRILMLTHEALLPFDLADTRALP
jgi:hypothetical protein